MREDRAPIFAEIKGIEVNPMLSDTISHSGLEEVIIVSVYVE